MSNSDQESVSARAPIPKEICPMALAAEAIGDRWILLILREAFFGVVRFEDMAADLNIARSVLTDRLGKMVDADLLEQVHYREQNKRTRAYYQLTEKGRGTAQVLIALMQWGEQAITGKDAPMQLVDRRDGQKLRLALLRTDGKSASFKDASILVE
jgi:DNA-binding HxlR family transcriptional regulator